MTQILDERLQAAVKLLGAIVPRKAHLPILSHVLITATPDGVTLAATNLETSLHLSLPARGSESWSLAVPFTALDLKRDYGTVVTLTPELDKHVLTLATDRSKQRAKGAKAEDFPHVQPINQQPVIGVAAATLKQAVEFVAEAVGKRDPIIHLFVQDNRLTLTALDGYRVHRASIDAPTTGSLNVPLPVESWRKLIRVIGKDDQVEIGADEGRVSFRFGSAELVSSVASTQLNSQVETILASRPVWAIQTEAGPLQRAIKRARIFGDTCQFVVQRYRPAGGPDWLAAQITLAAESAELGGVATLLDSQWDTCPGNVYFTLHTEYLADALGKVTKALAGGVVSLRFTGEHDGFFVEGTGNGLHLAAVMWPVVPAAARRVAVETRIDDEYKARVEADKKAETDYEAWVRDRFGLEGYSAYSQRASRAAYLRLQVSWNGYHKVDPDALIKEYAYYYMDGERP